VRDLKLLSEQCFCYFKSRIAIDSSLTLQISVEIVALFEKIYDGEPILTVVSNNGEDVHYNTVVSIKCMM
jgi:hypothetical protein